VLLLVAAFCTQVSVHVHFLMLQIKIYICRKQWSIQKEYQALAIRKDKEIK
jgi:hypothetical protein